MTSDKKQHIFAVDRDYTTLGTVKIGYETHEGNRIYVTLDKERTARFMQQGIAICEEQFAANMQGDKLASPYAGLLGPGQKSSDAEQERVREADFSELDRPQTEDETPF